MKDETAEIIAKELRLIREELQKLTIAIKSGKQNSNRPERTFQGRGSSPFKPEPDRKVQPARRPEDKRRQWHLPK